MSNQETPSVDPERRPVDQGQGSSSSDMYHSHPELQQPRPPVVRYILMLLVGFLMIGILYGFAVVQLGLLNAR